MTEERVLVEAALAGAPGAFERLVREHERLCWHIVFRMVRNAEDARELCQETFLRVHQCLRQFRYESALKTWIGRVAYSIALRHLERRRVMVSLDDEEDPRVPGEAPAEFDLEAACANAQLGEFLREAIDELPPVRRTVLTLYHVDDLSIPEIARITGLPPGTIKSHLFRTRLQLKEQLAPKLGKVG
jgi:RNA polymerase sigma factor (sigma-70 family)